MKIEEAILHAKEVAERHTTALQECAFQHNELADWLEELRAYKDTGMTPEEIQALKSSQWVYRSINAPSYEFGQTIRAVEKALGFRLFAWQKTYIAYGYFKQMGVTTAEILRELLNVSAEPIDYSRRAASESERFYRRELRKIKEKLDSAGIPTRTVFFSERDKAAYRKREGEIWND